MYVFFFFTCKVYDIFFFFFSSRRRHTRYWRDWSSDVCSSDLCGAPWCRTRSAYSVTVCGLLGLLTSGADAERRAGPVADALRCARHRGPDESGTWNDADVVFGFNRLSIIDVAGSHQPLQYED